MEEKEMCPDTDLEQESKQTAPIDLASLPLLHLYRPQGGLLFLQDEAVHQLEDEEAPKSAPFDQEQERLRNEDTQPLREPQQGPPQQQPAPKMGILIPVLILLVNSGIILSIVVLTLLQTVTIVLVPKTATITTRLTLTPVQSRVFSPLTLTQTKTVPATGHGSMPATQAQGSITFYNASAQAQTIEAGTLLTGSDGVQVVTDQTAYLAGSTPPTETQTVVTAHAVNPGAKGNIQVGDITGSCCRVNTFVDNTTFRGGQDAREYQSVTQADINGAVASLLPIITQAVNTSFEKHVRVSETLTPPVCSQAVITDHQVQQEAASVTVTVTKSCVAAAYTTADLQTQVVQTLSHTKPGYSLKAFFQLDSFHASLQQNRLSVSSTYQATFRYQFTQAETTRVLAQIKGKQKKQALAFLATLPGVEHISITTSLNQDSLPTDETYIHLLIFEG